MALWRKTFCIECKQEKMAAGPDAYRCIECENKRRAGRIESHFKALIQLTLEERLERLERIEFDRTQPKESQ